jgi:hypothetical protein
MFLTSGEIERLTGKLRPSAQIRWLLANGWRHTVSGDGHPVVAIAEANRKLVGGAAPQTRTPKWDKLNHGPTKAA